MWVWPLHLIRIISCLRDLHIIARFMESARYELMYNQNCLNRGHKHHAGFCIIQEAIGAEKLKELLNLLVINLLNLNNTLYCEICIHVYHWNRSLIRVQVLITNRACKRSGHHFIIISYIQNC